MFSKIIQTSASKEPHQCYFDKQFLVQMLCHEYVKLTEHKCFIQPVAAKEDQRKKKTKATLKRHRKKNPLASVYEGPPIFVYADFESMIAEDNTHTSPYWSAPSTLKIIPSKPTTGRIARPTF